MAYTGGWLASVSQKARGYELAPALPNHNVDNGSVAPDRAVLYQAPPMPSPDYDANVPGTQFIGGIDGTILDRSTTDPADGYASRPNEDVVHTLDRSGEAHSVNMGAAYAGVHAEIRNRDSDERYWTDEHAGIERTVIDVAASNILNRTSTPDVNADIQPGRFRYNRAWNVLKAVQAGAMPARYAMPKRIGDAAGIVNDIPPGTTKGTHPFSQLQRQIPNYRATPMTNQTPRPFDESFTTNGEDLVYAEPLGSLWS